MAKIVLDGLAEFAKAMAAIPEKMDIAARTITVQSAALIEARAKRNFEGSHARGMPHIGGNRPNVVTGNLRRSITHDPIHKVGPFTWETQVGPTAVYGRRVELGYAGGTCHGRQKTRPFPYLQPAQEGCEAQLRQIALTQWAKALS